MCMDPVICLCSTVIRSEAGKAELGVTITNPSGNNITYDSTPTPKGDRITYTPSIPGPYQIYITYGGLDVPGNVYL